MKWPIFAYNKRDRLREMRTRGREGVKNPENFAYVLNGSPLTSNESSCAAACTVCSVKTEAPPAGDFGRRSGRSFGRGSSGRNSEYPVLTGPPV